MAICVYMYHIILIGPNHPHSQDALALISSGNKLCFLLLLCIGFGIKESVSLSMCIFWQMSCVLAFSLCSAAANCFLKLGTVLVLVKEQ